MRASPRPATNDVIQPPTYELLEAELRAADTGFSAAELHGSLCAQLSAASELPGGNWIDIAAGGEVPRHELAESAWEMLEALYDWTLHGLDATDFTFELYLPDDDHALGDRADALGLWCAGYLSGLGQAGHADGGNLPDEAGEFVRDLADMARAGFDADEPSEEDEAAYLELLEYTRMGAMVIFETLRGPQDGAAIH